MLVGNPPFKHVAELVNDDERKLMDIASAGAVRLDKLLLAASMGCKIDILSFA